jgi:hypothetical protein
MEVTLPPGDDLAPGLGDKAGKEGLLAGLTASHSEDGRPISAGDRLLTLKRLVESGRLRTLVPVLPLTLKLNGKPYTLEDYYAFESVFQTRMPRQLLLKTGRQVSKSTSVASRGVILSAAIPHFATLYVTPLYEQIRRFSNNYVRPFIDTSPVKALWSGTTTENSVLQRSFKNGAKMFFSFALLDADRIRGISCKSVCFDEVQDMDPAHIPIIRECMSADRLWRLSMYTGTPKTLGNTIEGLWQKSSEGEWAIPCYACKKLNIPRMGYDLERMIGPWHKTIGKDRPGTICANPACGKVIFPRQGRWIHKQDKLRWKFAGYHIPQVIMPMHCEDEEAWSDLLGKRAGRGNVTPGKYHNEVLGESYDIGTKLINQSELERSCLLGWHNEPMNPQKALEAAPQYSIRCLAVDWGGGGEDEVSFTSLAVLGFRADGVIDVIYGRRLLTPHDHLEEAVQIIRTYRMFNCNMMAHDYTGAGSLRETVCIQAGLPMEGIMPMMYCRTAKQGPITFHQATQEHPRNYWMLDKARSLLTTCGAIKLRRVRFFKWDKEDDENPGLISEFLALQENYTETTSAGQIYSVVRNPMFPDDFAQAVNIGCAAIWHRTQTWPNLAELAGLQLTIQQMASAGPENPWIEDTLGGYFRGP